MSVVLALLHCCRCHREASLEAAPMCTFPDRAAAIGWKADLHPVANEPLDLCPECLSPNSVSPADGAPQALLAAGEAPATSLGEPGATDRLARDSAPPPADRVGGEPLSQWRRR